MFADVLILHQESNYDQVLTYLLPENDFSVEAGSLVLVPLKQHTQRGLILKVYREKPAVRGRIRPIREVLEKKPPVTPRGLAFARWISEYYVCSLNKAVHLFLPPPVRQKERQVLVLGAQKSSERLFLGEKEAEILEYINSRNEKKALPAEIARRFGKESGNALNALLKNEFLRMNREYVPQVAEKKKRVAAITSLAPDWKEIVKKAPRQAEVVRALQQGPLTYDKIGHDYGSVRAAVKALVKKGWVAISEETESRNPCLERLASKRPYELNNHQATACEKIIASIRNRENKKWLLFGVTGSGKTEVYLKAMEESLRLGRQVLYLVPEIALTPQITSLLIDTFGSSVALLHSALTPGERNDEWMRIRKGEARVVLGPRSAVFAPFTDLGLIIIDEEHENTYKQSEPDPRYDARTAASYLAESFGAVLLAGSATPSLRTYSKALKGQYEMVRLPERVAERSLPAIKVIDMKKEAGEGNKSIFSRYLLTALERVVADGEQALLFMNRRGFHTFVLCRECGKSLTCSHCSVSLTYHYFSSQLICHYCNYRRQIPQKCPFCGSHFIRYFGTGTERVVRELKHYLPQAKILRMDADTTRTKGSHTKILKEFQERKAPVLIGTQMIAKGLDFPNVTLVGVINADVLVNMPDYQAGERAYQLISQVAGRAGRGYLPGEVVIQTFNPAHYIFSAAIRQDYEEYFQNEMTNRELLMYPPVHSLIRVLVSGIEEKKVLERVDYLAKMLKIEIGKKKWELEVLGPSPAPLSYLKGRMRCHILIKGKNLDDMRYLARMVREKARGMSLEPRIIIDVEPHNLL